MKTVVGIFTNRDDAEGARSDFARLGLSPQNVGMLSSVAPDAAAATPGTGLFELPNIGRVAATGAMRELLDKSGAAKSPDGILAAMAKMGINRADAARYLDGVRRGSILEAVHVDDDKEADALAIMRQRMISNATFPGVAADVVIPVIEEELRIGKRQVDVGGVRVTTKVRELPVERTITVRHERVKVERRSVDRPIQAMGDPFEDHVYELRATAEQPVVTKRARVVEEIRVHKESTERVEKISDTLRRTNVQLTQIPMDADPLRARFLDHFSQTYGAGRYQFESVLPAYEFGERLRTHYKGRDWSSVEADIRAKWEGTNPGTWEHYREAIRSAWFRAAS